MQHLDEGAIHSWLDGALSPEEAARVEAHAAECPECASAVAEARGFIAASSRILTALDNAPRGVIPAAAPKKRFDPFVWRIAATLLVVAAGTLVVVRTRGADQRAGATVSDAAVPATTSATTAAAPAPLRISGSAGEAVPKTVELQRPTTRADAARKAAVERAPAPAPAPVADIAGRRQESAAGIAPQTSQRFGAPGNGAAVGAISAPAAMTPSRSADVAITDRSAESTSLRVIGQPRQIGAHVTIYEIGGDTVTLTESVPLSLESVVATRAAAARQPQKAEPRQAVTLNAPVAAATSPPAAAPMRKAADSANVITWYDPATTSTLTLTGRVSAARLGELKVRIQRERAAAAAAAAKKTP